MFQQWIARFVSVIFLIEVLFPASVVHAAVPSAQKISRELNAQVQASRNVPCVPQALADEKLRAADPFRQTDLAKEIVCLHQQGAKKDSGKGFASRGREAAREEAGPMQFQTEAIAESTAIRRPIPPQPLLSEKSRKAVPATPKDPYRREVSRVASGFKTTVIWRDEQGLFEKWTVDQLESRIKSPDFSFDELLDFMDPYEPSGYDPVVTTVAAEALNVWFQSAMMNFLGDEDVLEGLAFYAPDLEQRALYRLAFLESKPLETRSFNEIRAIGSLRMMLWSLYVFEHEILSKHPDIYAHYNRDSIFTIRHNGYGLGSIQFKKALREIEQLGAKIKHDDPTSVPSQLNLLLSYAVPFGLMRSQSGLLIDSNEKSISKNSWVSVHNIMKRLEVMTKRERYISDTPYGNYLQASTLLYSAFAASLQQSLTEADLQGERLTNLIAMLKEAANVSTQSTPSVITAAELASFLIRERKVNMSAEDRKYFANALESVYCRSAIGHQNNLYNKAGVKQNIGSSTSGLRNMAQLYFESFGFQDVKQHAEFMQGLAKIHQAFATPRTVYKPINRKMDRLVFWEEGFDGKTTNRKLGELPPGDFYYQCILDNNYKRNPVLASKEVARVIGAVVVEILIWVAFDGAFRIVGKFVSPLFRAGFASMRALPRAIAVAGKAARNGRLAGLAAGTREIREAVVLAKKMSKVQAHGGSIVAVTSKGTVKYSHAEPGRLALSGPGVTATSPQFTVNVENIYEMIPAARPWTKWSDPLNRRLFGFGPARKEIESVVLSQGNRTIAINMRALGLEKGISTLGDWERLMSAAAKNGFKFEPLTGAALRQARVEAYMSAQAASQVASQNWLTSHLPGATKYWKYGGEKVGWVQISQKEFMDLHAGLLHNQAQAAGVISGTNHVLENYYEILGVARNASQREIRDAWKRQIMLAHPDKGGVPWMASKINGAYDILSNPVKREAFDRMLDLGGAAMLENEARQSLAITLRGSTFNGTNGIAFGSSSVDLDVTAAVKKYMTDNNLFNSFRMNLAKLPTYWQGSYYSVTRFLPVMYGADYLLQDHFRESLKSQVEGEQKEVLAPFQAKLDALEQKSKEQNLPPTLLSLYDKVSAVEPLVGSWLGMPYLSFAGSSMGTGLYQIWHHALEPLSPWKLHLVNQENRQIIRDNAQYSLTSNAVNEGLQEHLKQQSVESAMAPLRKQHQESIAQLKEKYGETVSQEADRYWTQFLQDMQQLLGSKKKEEELTKEVAQLNARLSSQLQRCATIAQVSAEKADFMDQFALAPQTMQKQVEALYDRYIKEVTGIASNLKLSDSKAEKLIDKASKKLLKQVEQLSASAGLSSAATYQEQDSGMEYEVENIEDETDYFSYIYSNFLHTYADIYPATVTEELTALSAPALQRMDAIVSSVEFTEKEKREQLRQVKREVMSKASAILQAHEPDYLKQYAAIRSQMISTAIVYTTDSGSIASIRYMLDEGEEELHALLQKLAKKTKEQRQKKIQEFFANLQKKYLLELQASQPEE